MEGSTRQIADAIESLRTAFPGCGVILIAPHIERWEVRAALAAGASGVLLDDGELPRSLPGCLAAVRAGQICVPRQHARQVVPPALSAREKQVLGLVVMGYMNCQIAERLFLAESTVKSHLSSAFGKLGVRSRNEAVSMILDPERGLGTGILALAGEPIDAPPLAAR
jgi:DNA-binding NarL/FixJ family response regulator